MFIGDTDTDAQFNGLDVSHLLSNLDLGGYDLSDSANSQTLWDTSAGHIPEAAVQQGAGSGLDADMVDGYEAEDLRSEANHARLSSTDTTTDINTTSWVTIAWNTEYRLDGDYSHDAANSPGTITFDTAGTYRVFVSVAYDVGGADVNPGIKLNHNGTRKKTFGLTGGVSNANGAVEGSNVAMRTIEAAAGDTLKVQCMAMGNTTPSATMRSEESILEIEQVSEVSVMATDADTLDGYNSSAFMQTSGDTMSGGTLGLDRTGSADAVAMTDTSGGTASEHTVRYDGIPTAFEAGSNGATTVYMDQSNRVGIQTASPAYALDVSGTVNVGTDILGSGSVVWDSSNSHVPESALQTLSNAALSNSSVTVAGNAVSLGGSTSVAHTDLSSIGAEDHHAQIQVSDSGTAVLTQPTDVDFANAISVTDDTDGTVTIDVAEGSISHDNISGVSSGDHHSRYADEEARDAASAMLSGGTDISLTKDDANNTVTIDMSGTYDNYGSWTFEEGDGESTAVGSGERAVINGSSQITTELVSTSPPQIDVNHANTTSQGNADAGSGTATVIESITLDGNGHVTGITTGNRDVDDWGAAYGDVDMGASGLISTGRVEFGNQEHVDLSGRDITWDDSEGGGGSAGGFIYRDSNGNNRWVVNSSSGDYDIQKNGTDGTGVINFKT